jgi:hypothetical protein
MTSKSIFNDPPGRRAFKENNRYEKLRRRYGSKAMLNAPCGLELTPGDPEGDADRPCPTEPYPSVAALNDWQRHDNNRKRGTGCTGEEERTLWDDFDLCAERYPELTVEEESAD